MAGKGKPEVLGARYACAYGNRTRPHGTQEYTMAPSTPDAKKHVKARRRRCLKAHERLARDRRQAQHAAESLQQALNNLGLPEDLGTEIAGRLRSPQQLFGKIVGMMFPSLCGCRTNCELYGVRGWDKHLSFPIRDCSKQACTFPAMSF
jgi:hypothetical protein